MSRLLKGLAIAGTGLGLSLSTVSLSTPVAAAATKTVVWWTQADPSFVKADKLIAEQFESMHRDIKVVVQPYPYNVFLAKLKTASATHTGPDVAQIWGEWADQLINDGILEPIPDSWLSLSQAEKVFYPADLGGLTMNGKLYGIPHETNEVYGGLFLNTEVFNKAHITPPKHVTWPQMLRLAEKLTVYGKNETIQRAGLGNLDPKDDDFSISLALILQQGGQYFNQNGQVNFNTPQAQKAFGVFVDLINKYKVESPALDTLGNALFTGQEAMAYDGAWVISDAQTNFPHFKFRYIPFPQMPGAKNYLWPVPQGWSEGMMAKGASNPAAGEFIKYLTSVPVEAEFNAINNELPSEKAVTKSPLYLKKVDPATRVILSILPYAVYEGRFWNFDQAEKDFQTMLQAVEANKMTLTQGLSQLTQQINQLISLTSGQ